MKTHHVKHINPVNFPVKPEITQRLVSTHMNVDRLLGRLPKVHVRSSSHPLELRPYFYGLLFLVLSALWPNFISFELRRMNTGTLSTPPVAVDSTFTEFKNSRLPFMAEKQLEPNTPRVDQKPHQSPHQSLLNAIDEVEKILGPKTFRSDKISPRVNSALNRINGFEKGRAWIE